MTRQRRSLSPPPPAVRLPWPTRKCVQSPWTTTGMLVEDELLSFAQDATLVSNAVFCITGLRMAQRDMVTTFIVPVGPCSRHRNLKEAGLAMLVVYGIFKSTLWCPTVPLRPSPPRPRRTASGRLGPSVPAHEPASEPAHEPADETTAQHSLSGISMDVLLCPSPAQGPSQSESRAKK